MSGAKLFAVLLILCLAASPISGFAAEKAAPIIACVIRTGSIYWQNVKRGIDDVAGTVGAEVLYLYTAGQEKVLDNASAVRIAALSDVDIILTTYNNDPVFAKNVTAAREQGVIVVFMDTDGPAELRDFFVGIDYPAAGTEIAEAMLGVLNPGDHALLCMSPVYSEYQSQALLARAIQDTFASSECTIDLFSDSMNVDYERQTELDQYIQAHPEVHGIFSLSQLQTRGYAQMLDGAEWGDRVHLIGLDYQDAILPDIRGGSILAILEKNSYDLGATSARTALEAAAGQPPSGDKVVIDYVILTGGNIDAYLAEVGAQ